MRKFGKHDKQYTYKVRLWRSHFTIVYMEAQQYVPFLLLLTHI
jgi:hypothetical protein